jgi:hypothetical protein
MKKEESTNEIKSGSAAVTAGSTRKATYRIEFR